MSSVTFTKLVTEILAHTSSKEVVQSNHNPGNCLYDSYSKKLLNTFGALKKETGKFVIFFNKGTRNILSIEVQKNAIKVTINAKYGKLKDSKGILRDVSNVGHWGNGDYQVKLDSEEHLDYICEIIKQIY